MRRIEHFNLFNSVNSIRIDINKSESFYESKSLSLHNTEDESSHSYKTLLDFKNYISESSTEVLTPPLGDGDKDKIKNALWDKLMTTPELKSRYGLSTTNKLEFFKFSNLKTNNILDDVKIEFSSDDIVLNIAGLGKNHEVKVKLDKSLNSPNFKLSATFNLGNIFGYK
jgi:hypothetical protein